MSELTVSPLAPAAFPMLPAVGGVRLATHAAGLRYQGRDDIWLAEVADGTVVAGVFTKTLCPSAPVDWCRQLLDTDPNSDADSGLVPPGRARAVVCNSGNANAFTGAAGTEAVQRTAAAVADQLQISPSEVFLASTGVIGEALPTEPLVAGLKVAAGGLADSSPESWAASAHAIRTTDTFAKGASVTLALAADEAPIAVVGIAKGSGMIAPDMATMLGFVFTDAPVAQPVLQALLSRATDASFNRITVDSDTSTSDTVLAFATGAASGAGVAPVESIDDPRAVALGEALAEVSLALAHQIVRDGEGATKFVEVTVTGAESDAAAEVIALAIGNSPLVKTALAAEDANWGRIVMAVGKAGERAARDALAIWIGSEQCAEHGMVRPGYSEAAATEHLRGDEVVLRVDVGVGDGEATIWTCDLTHGYIDINAGYRS